MHQIDEAVSKRLDVQPIQVRVVVTRRPKFACRACEGAIVQAPGRNVFIKVVGPQATVESNRKAFEAMIAGMR